MTKNLIAPVIAGDIFTTLDTDKNGAIGIEEIDAMPNSTGQWEALDTDVDGEPNDKESSG